MNWADDLRIKLETSQVISIVHTVRNILLEWTIEMEKQGILGENLSFTPEDREKSASLTAQTVNNFNIAQVGSFVQSAQHSVVQGGIGSAIDFAADVQRFVREMEPLLSAADLPSPIRDSAHQALSDLKGDTIASNPDIGRLRKGLEALKRTLAPAAESVIKIAVDTAVTKLLGW
jgi:hypothetical protein